MKPKDSNNKKEDTRNEADWKGKKKRTRLALSRDPRFVHLHGASPRASRSARSSPLAMGSLFVYFVTPNVDTVFAIVRSRLHALDDSAMLFKVCLSVSNHTLAAASGRSWRFFLLCAQPL